APRPPDTSRRPPAGSAVPAPRRDQRAAPARPRLEVLDQAAARRRSRRRNALMAAFVLVLVGFFLVAFVHASLVAGQQHLDEMRTRIAELQAEKASVERGIEESSAPARIVDRAGQLGMVRAEDPVFLAAVRSATPTAAAPAGGDDSAG
ncbi:MAG: hypothetical protein OEY70_12360, partial [Acidimicrobiia bacterium]|nr:hypothetical protein [Acidimicrobiia bacterium]